MGSSRYCHINAQDREVNNAKKQGNPNNANGIAHQKSLIYVAGPKAIQYKELRKKPKPNKYPNIAACFLQIL